VVGIVHAATPADRPRITEFMLRNWGSSRMAVHGRVFEVPHLSGFVAEVDGELCGHLHYLVEAASVEVVWIGTVGERQGAGSALLAACARLARDRGLERMWLVTTNDNLDALRFYQRRGFRLLAVHPDAVDDARRDLKPEIPETGSFGIPMRDELQLELRRGEWDDLIERYSWPIA
jgi:GNAT superfamily N-acetyltransferase